MKRLQESETIDTIYGQEGLIDEKKKARHNGIISYIKNIKNWQIKMRK